MSDLKTPCRVCGNDANYIGGKIGKYNVRKFSFYRCGDCAFTFIGDPWTEYAEIYNRAYYRGEGADPLVDYHFELDHPDQTIRLYEWRGILQAVNALHAVTPQTKWIDFGCGNGGLVRYVKQHASCNIQGFEEGWIADTARSLDIPILYERELPAHEGTCDIVTAIEVIEHVEKPVEFLQAVRKLLKPGGVLFLTTGNAAPHRKNIFDWGYTTPEIHISFFEPATLERAMKLAGFTPEHHGFLPGFADIIRFKVLKNLKLRQPALWERVLPWTLLSRIVDRVHRVTAHPAGRVTAPR